MCFTQLQKYGHRIATVFRFAHTAALMFFCDRLQNMHPNAAFQFRNAALLVRLRFRCGGIGFRNDQLALFDVGIQLDLGIFDLCARLDGVIHEIAEHDDQIRVRDRQFDR